MHTNESVIKIHHVMVEISVLEDYLPSQITAYRGMSVEGYKLGRFGMSWSEDKAKEFAFYVYKDKPITVVVKAIIERSRVLFFSPTDTEKEIVVENEKITDGEVVLT